MARRVKLTKEWWIKLLNKHHIVWRDHGHNVKKGNLQLECPFCGPSHYGKFHMGLQPETGAYGCWRSSQHRGKAPKHLLIKLLHMTASKVDELLGEAGVPDVDSWEDLTSNLNEIFTTGSAGKKGPDSLYMPKSFLPIQPFGDSQVYFEYLQHTRGFPRADVRKVISRYDLHYCDEWDDDQALNFHGRIITPVTLDGELVTWGSRTISSKEKLRYKSLGADNSVVPIEETIYNFDNALEGGRILLVVEGQVDVWKLDYYGHRYGIHTVGVFNKSVTEKQLYLLDELFDLYTNRAVLLDSGAEAEATLLAGKLSGRHHVDAISFNEAEDPGAATPDQLKQFFGALLKKYYPNRKFML